MRGGSVEEGFARGGLACEAVEMARTQSPFAVDEERTVDIQYT